MNLSSIVSGIGDAFQNMFYPSQKPEETQAADSVPQSNASDGEQVEQQSQANEAQNPIPKHQEIPEHPTTGLHQGLINLATDVNHRMTGQAAQSHQLVREKTALMSKQLQHQELLRGIHENTEKDVYDFSQDQQLLECFAFLNEHGIDVPKGKTITKNQCLTLHRKVEALYKNTDSEQKIAVNTFHEHTQLRDRIFEIIKSCCDMIRSAIQKISGHIGK